MSRITWNAPNERVFETGIDRAVLYLNDGSATPWNGLISVDEKGSDGVVSSYLDGLPYLHFPIPKDYSATIEAYTYPDAFSEILGLVEINDIAGMYADSQVGATFSLSYRTLIGNATEGIDYAYKIHLVYNAVVVPPSFGYDSMGSDINASTFSWDISAVPVPVEGYRPTAHFVIDTRHMDPEIVVKLERILYGDETTDASLPEPIDVIELLAYGGAIIIIDNGDGTWTAKGSRHNIYLLDEDTFQIDHVENTNYGDGTFGITTTQT